MQLIYNKIHIINRYNIQSDIEIDSDALDFNIEISIIR